MKLGDLDPTRDFAIRLLDGANLPSTIQPEDRDTRLEGGPKSQIHYELILDALATIRKYKVLSYGESRYDVSSPKFDLAMAFSDIHRKYIRLREQIFGEKSINTTTESLADSAADLANYSIMLLEIVATLELMKEQKK